MSDQSSNDNFQQQNALTAVSDEAKLHLDGELNLSDYVQDIAPNSKMVHEVSEWAAKQKEEARTKIATRLMTIFGGTLTASILLMGAAAFNPNADKALIKDLIPQVITPQVTLLGVTLGYYFTTKEER